MPLRGASGIILTVFPLCHLPLCGGRESIAVLSLLHDNACTNMPGSTRYSTITHTQVPGNRNGWEGLMKRGLCGGGWWRALQQRTLPSSSSMPARRRRSQVWQRIAETHNPFLDLDDDAQPPMCLRVSMNGSPVFTAQHREGGPKRSKEEGHPTTPH